jgi:hypothetical protein
VLPNVSEIPTLLTSIRHPRRRAVSIGPQSEADAYETLAYREKRRRESTASDHSLGSSGQPVGALQNSDNLQSIPILNDTPSPKSVTRDPLKLDSFECEAAAGTPLHGAEIGPAGAGSDPRVNTANSVGCDYDEQDEQAMFSMITRPRVRYDVEVVTKLIVYSGRFHPRPLPPCATLY